MLKKTKILIMSLCLGLIPFSVSNAMKPNVMNQMGINEKKVIKVKDVDVYLEKILKTKKYYIDELTKIMEVCLEKNKEKLSPFRIDLLARLYVECKLSIHLNSEGKLDFQKFLMSLNRCGIIESGVKEVALTRQAFKRLEEVEQEIKSYDYEMKKQLQYFCSIYKKYESQLNEKINRYNKMMILSDDNMGVFFKKWCDEAYRDRIYEYIGYLQKSYESFRKTWNYYLKNYSDKQQLTSEDLKKFAAAYHLAMSKIFLEKNGDVKVYEFLRKVMRQEHTAFDITRIESSLINEKNRNILKEVFVEYKKLVEKKVEQFYKEHKDYREALEKELNKKTSFDDIERVVFGDMFKELSENNEHPVFVFGDLKNVLERISKDDNFFIDNFEFCAGDDIKEKNVINEASEENIANNIFERKINGYVEKLSNDFKKFKTEWENLLTEYRFKEKLLNADLEKFAAIYNLAMSKIFLDEKNNVRVDEFLRKLEKNGDKYENKLTQDQKDILKDAFVQYKGFVGKELEKFYKVYQDYKEQLNKKLDRKIIIFDDVEELKEYSFENRFPIENYLDFFNSDLSGKYFNKYLENKINRYLGNFQNNILEFQNKWACLLKEHRLEKELSPEVLEKLAEYYNAAMSRIFLDENNNVKVDEFLKKLEEQYKEKYRGLLPKGQEAILITQEQKNILKNAFVQYKKLINEEIENFYGVYQNYREQINKKLNEK